MRNGTVENQATARTCRSRQCAICSTLSVDKRFHSRSYGGSGWNSVATATAEKHPFSRIFFVAYICFTTLTLLNIVTGKLLSTSMTTRLQAARPAQGVVCKTPTRKVRTVSLALDCASNVDPPRHHSGCIRGHVQSLVEGSKLQRQLGEGHKQRESAVGSI